MKRYLKDENNMHRTRCYFKPSRNYAYWSTQLRLSILCSSVPTALEDEILEIAPRFYELLLNSMRVFNSVCGVPRMIVARPTPVEHLKFEGVLLTNSHKPKDPRGQYANSSTISASICYLANLESNLR